MENKKKFRKVLDNLTYYKELINQKNKKYFDVAASL